MIKLYATVLREETRQDGEYVLLENGIYRCWMTKAEFSAFQIEPPKAKAPEAPALAPDNVTPWRKKPSIKLSDTMPGK